MSLDIQALERFYDSRIGLVTRRLIFRRIRGAWPSVAGQRVLGLGYASPYMRPFVGEAERNIAAIPEGFGATPFGASSGLCSTAIVDDLALPFPDAFFDAVLVVHGLETAEAQRPFLRELWRVLTPAGRLMIIAPNRASLWAQLESSPFGHGQPYSRGQLDRLLKQALFSPERWDAALFMPPWGRNPSLRAGRAWEKVGHTAWPRLAGVHLVDATKSMYVPSLAVKKRRAVLRPAMAYGR
jgi:SAM-dependent methyltransferase